MTAKKLVPAASMPARKSALVQPLPVAPGDPLPPVGHRVPVADRVPGHLPVQYADQVIDVIYGVHTTKVVLGIETGGGGLRTVGVIAIPTASLLVLAANIVRDLTAPGIVEETAQRLGSVVTMMRDMASAAAANDLRSKKGK